MADAGEVHVRTRGKGYPRVPLGNAAEVVTEAIKYGTTHGEDAFARFMGHGKASGGAYRQNIAAYRDWGLIGRGSDRIVLTELARRIAMPVDEQQLQAGLQEAFRTADTMVAAYDATVKGQPVDAKAIAYNAVHTLGIAPPSADSFAKSFSESVVAARLGEDLGNGKLRLHASAETAPDEAELAPLGVEGRPQHAVVHGQPGSGKTQMFVHAAAAAQALIPQKYRDVWEFPGGEVTLEIRSRSPLPAGAYVQLGAVVPEIEGLVDRLAVDAARRTESPAKDRHVTLAELATEEPLHSEDG
jgi:hypothetical protein